MQEETNHLKRYVTYKNNHVKVTENNTTKAKDNWYPKTQK